MKNSPALRWLWQMCRRYVAAILLLALISGLMSGGLVLFALLSQRVVDIATGSIDGMLWLYGGGILLLLGVEAALRALNHYLTVWVQGKLDMHIQQRMFSTLFRKRWPDVRAYHSGDLIHRLSHDTYVVVNTLTTLLPQVISMLTRLIACLVVMVTMDLRFTLILLVLGMLMLFCSRFYGKKSKEFHKTAQRQAGESRSFMQEGIENWMVVQSFNGGQTISNRLLPYLGRYFRTCLRRANWSNISHTAVYLLFSGSYYVALLWCALRLAAGTISYGTMVAFLEIVGQIRTPFVNMSGIIPRYYNMLASAERLIELEDLEDEPCPALPYETDELYRRLQSLEVQDLFFSYEEDRPVLQGASLSIRKGEFIALAGFSGIGKSTLFRLLLGFLPPNSGSVSVCLEEGESIPVGAATRGLFAYVPQQNMLLSGTIRDNILFCSGDKDDEAVWAAAEVADVADVIRQLPDGLDTMLSERGGGLSEGQIQRLAIARAVLYEAPILLLDEATSSLDEASEERVLKNLRALPGRTCICISHRPAALAVCDRVIRVEDGQFVQE